MLPRVLNVIKMPRIRTPPQRLELKVKKAICVIRRGAEPAVEICKSRSLRDASFHHGGAAAEQRAIAIFGKTRR